MKLKMHRFQSIRKNVLVCFLLYLPVLFFAQDTIPPLNSDSSFDQAWRTASVFAYDRAWEKHEQGDNMGALNDLSTLHPIFKFEGNEDFSIYTLFYRFDLLGKTRQFEEAKELSKYLEKEILIYQDGCNYQLIGDLSYHLASLNLHDGNLTLAEHYLNIYFENYSYGAGTSMALIFVYDLQSKIQQLKGDIHEAFSSSLIALPHTQILQQSAVPGALCQGYSRLASNQLKLNLISEAKESLVLADIEYKKGVHFKRVKLYYYTVLLDFKIKENQLNNIDDILDKIYNLDEINDENKIYYHYYLGKIYALKDESEKALQEFNKTLTLIKNTPYLTFLTYETQLDVSEIYKRKGDLRMAHNTLDKALTIMWRGYKTKNINSSSPILSNFYAINALIKKNEIYILENNINALESNSKLTLDIINLLLGDKDFSDKSKFYYLEQFRNHFEEIIEILLTSKRHKTAHYISAKLHGNIISQSVLENTDINNLNISYSFLELEEKHKLRMDVEKNKLLTLKDVSKHDSLLAVYHIAHAEHQNVVKKIKSEYPTYKMYEQSRSLKNDSKEDIHKKINKNAALVEYFLGEKNLYTFLVTNSDLIVFTKAIDSTFLDNINSLNDATRSISSDFKQFSQISHKLYNYLLKDVIESLDLSIDQLYIVPDNEISYIPFGALIKSIPAESIANSRYDLLPYLIKDYSMSYHYSSSLLNLEKTDLSTKLSGYAPSFTSNFSTTENLESLLHNKEEVLIINDITEGQLNIDTSANLENLKHSINNYTIAHLATHAICNDTLPFQSKIYFEDGALHAYEIYNMPHNLELAVLSACETGTGELKKGEGLMSLARAFISSGCKTVITSLWNVNDKNSSVLMQSFYKHLWSGKSVGTSLAQSKRDYLNNVNSVLQAHPYHWATFITIGNADMAIPQFPWLAVLSFGVLSFLILLFAKKWKKASKP